jgi:hypothetical protein
LIILSSFIATAKPSDTQILVLSLTLFIMTRTEATIMLPPSLIV